MFTVLTIVSGAVILTLNCVMCLDNGLARTPPMGWNTWQVFGCQLNCQRYPNNCLNEDAIKRTADKLVSDGWRDLGYKYVILDDCWLATQRDPITNRIMADPSRFPSLWIRKLNNRPKGWAIACIYTKVDGGPINFSTNLDEFKSQMYTISGDKFELLDVFTGDIFKDVQLTENFTISINPSGIMMFRVNPYKLVYSYQ
ncbi:hypothetical protein MS3_00000638 [Schistosoma haematobium]|uniref:Alpha-galactosidase n=1 Tax=Schistosoma haematobium TaxID=6185 RepID=A0A922ILK9_SCHHA|nr:hypothetical protein MS3_00000638 [Schistosoma haematobium]KAH9581776.1 hypothetical protein MS3_00000638 [Schistosoma haematobium]